MPPSLNELITGKYRNHHARRRLREAWEQELIAVIGPDIRRKVREFINETDPPRKMRLNLFVGRKRLLDPDNLYGGAKPVIDAIKKVALLYDDSVAYINLEIHQYSCGKAKPSTLITLEPFEEEK